jgi:hypothetical protein
MATITGGTTMEEHDSEGIDRKDTWDESDWAREEEVICAGCGILVAKALTMTIRNVIRCADCYEQWSVTRQYHTGNA